MGLPGALCSPRTYPEKKPYIFSKKAFLYFEKWNFPSSKKKVYILLKKVFLIFREMQFSGPKVKKFQKALNSKLEKQKNVSIFS